MTLPLIHSGAAATVTGPWSPAVEDAVLRLGITELELNYAKGWQGRDVSFLERLPGLESLTIIDRQIDDVAAIHALPNLRRLSVNTYCKTPIDAARLPRLEGLGFEWRPRSESVFDHRGLAKLFINHCPVIDLAPLAKMTALRSLSLASPRLESVRGIEALTALTFLGVYVARRLTSLEGLQGATQLEELEVTDSKKVGDVTPIAALRRLRRLHLNNDGKIASFRPLAGLIELEELLFDESTNVLDGELSPLLGLPKLRNVAFMERKHYSHGWADFPGAG